MFLIFGKGKSGKAAAKLLKSLNLPFELVDDSTPNWENLLKNATTVVVSPGIPPTHKVFELSKKLKKELIGETELAYRFWEGEVIAITGTDGKSTTTRAVFKILSAHLSGVYEGGNIGRPFSEIVTRTRRGIAVLEVSSFQGYTLKTFKPKVGIFLNFSEDHLNWHSDLEDYLRGKYSIFKNQTPDDYAFLNETQREVINTPTPARVFTFGKDTSDIAIKNGWLTFGGERLFETSKVRLKGKHNLLNLGIAAAVGLLYGVPLRVIREVVYNFEGLPYRLQYLGRFRGVEVYNDSKSTTPNALRAALESFEKPVILILGGKDKGADFGVLEPLFREKVKLAVAYGENGEKIYSRLRRACNFVRVKTLEEAVRVAFGRAEEGDTLLFSPASASFDQFKSYEERGEAFNRLVREMV